MYTTCIPHVHHMYITCMYTTWRACMTSCLRSFIAIGTKPTYHGLGVATSLMKCLSGVNTLDPPSDLSPLSPLVCTVVAHRIQVSCPPHSTQWVAILQYATGKGRSRCRAAGIYQWTAHNGKQGQLLTEGAMEKTHSFPAILLSRCSVAITKILPIEWL